MSVSLATKIGSAGAVVASGGSAGTYYAWDYITLYEVEREVINKNVQLDKGTVSNDNLAIVTVKAISGSGSTFENLSTNFEWSCKIKIIPQNGSSTGTSTTRATDLWDKLKNKKLLVKACSEQKDLTEEPSHKKVIGTLDIKEIDSSAKTFSFENNPELADLLKAVSTNS